MPPKSHSSPKKTQSDKTQAVQQNREVNNLNEISSQIRDLYENLPEEKFRDSENQLSFDNVTKIVIIEQNISESLKNAFYILSQSPKPLTEIPKNRSKTSDSF